MPDVFAGGDQKGVLIVWTDENGDATGTKIVLDAATSDHHTLDSEITEHPVEKGVNPVDHSRPRPAQLDVEALVTDYPVNIRGGGIGAPGGKGRSNEVFETLDKLRKNATLLKVYTGLRAYSNMLIKTLSTNRDKTLKGALRLSISFTEVRIVQSQTVPVQVASTNTAQPKANTGPQSGQQAAEPLKSRAADLVDNPGQIVDGLKSLSPF